VLFTVPCELHMGGSLCIMNPVCCSNIWNCLHKENLVSADCIRQLSSQHCCHFQSSNSMTSASATPKSAFPTPELLLSPRQHVFKKSQQHILHHCGKPIEFRASRIVGGNRCMSPLITLYFHYIFPHIAKFMQTCLFS